MNDSFCNYFVLLPIISAVPDVTFLKPNFVFIKMFQKIVNNNQKFLSTSPKIILIYVVKMEYVQLIAQLQRYTLPVQLKIKKTSQKTLLFVILPAYTKNTMIFKRPEELFCVGTYMCCMSKPPFEVLVLHVRLYRRNEWRAGRDMARYRFGVIHPKAYLNSLVQIQYLR